MLPGGTIGIPEWEDSYTAAQPPRAIPDADAPAVLPELVHLRGMSETANRRYWFALHQGSLWFRPNLEVTGIDGDWGRVPWVVQLNVPGEITDRLSITKSGTGAIQRQLRIEGRDAEGHTGYWQKDIGAGSAHPWINASSASRVSHRHPHHPIAYG